MSNPGKSRDTASSASGNEEWEKMLGPSLIQHSKTAGTSNNGGGEPAPTKYTTLKTGDALKDKEFVLLYFSASWCPPCQAFSPMLKSFYKLVNDKIEIIYISSDKSVSQFEEYFGTMPWLSLPVAGTAAIKSALAQSMQISGIPALIVMTREGGLFVTDKAREQVTTCVRNSGSSNAAQDNAKELVRQWREDVPAVPLSEAKIGSGGGSQGIMGLVMALLKNPAAIFAIVYFVKWAMRKHQTLTQQGGEEGVDDAAAALNVEEHGAEEQEF
ncbi:hypothetical protein ACA910_000031 [Epithemia clementina (nom. ined.)]